MSTTSPTPAAPPTRRHADGGHGSPTVHPSVDAGTLHSLVYVSVANLTLTGSDLHELQQQSRRHNRALDVTGLLLYRAGTFLQLLEGDEDTVEDLYTAITADQRHHDVLLVRRRPQPFRQFPRWAMAYGDVDPAGTRPVQVQVPPTAGPAPQTADEARFIFELLDVFDPRPVEPGHRPG